MSLPTPAGDPVPSADHSVDPFCDDRPRLRASGPSEILQVIPYLLGFHPESSVVLVAMRGKTVVVSVRYDLAAPPQIAEPFCRSASRAGATSALVVIYADEIDGHPLAHREYLGALSELLEQYELDEVDALAVGDGRWWSYRCRNARCCPPDGTRLETAGALAAGAVAEGLVALPGRADLEAELAPDAERMADVLAALCEVGDEQDDRPDNVVRAEEWAAVRRFVAAARRGATPPTPEQAARVLWALMDIAVRDATIGFLVSRPDPKVAAAWRDLVRVAPPLWRAPVATIYALWCFAAGSGARCNVGIEAALAAHPNYSMARLLDEAVFGGVNPFEFTAVMAKDAKRVGHRIQRKRYPWGPRRAARGS